jgi:membrane protease YdiL (CAAX protease family)
VPDRLASPRTAPFLEAFALYLASHIVLSLLVHFVFKTSSLALNWLMVPVLPVLVLWPAWRGVKWSDVRRGLGLHTGKGVLWEAGAGVLGYVAGLPVFVTGVLLTGLLTRIGDAAPSHPLQFEVGKSWLTNLHLYLLACAWAPLTEELMFRGSLFHHLRRRWNWVISAGVVSLIFAAIHPQGWAAIPALGSLALVFAAVREWRGSLVAPMVGHFIQNFVVTTVMILMMG